MGGSSHCIAIDIGLLLIGKSSTKTNYVPLIHDNSYVTTDKSKTLLNAEKIRFLLVLVFPIAFHHALFTTFLERHWLQILRIGAGSEIVWGIYDVKNIDIVRFNNSPTTTFPASTAKRLDCK
ncbi:hypothetical protein C7W93_10785 [Glaciimonas sp. PCH181]|nr:hypothetical protein C7W93_10785 [Glaciimonas sp. PCH181]